MSRDRFSTVLAAVLALQLALPAPAPAETADSAVTPAEIDAALAARAAGQEEARATVHELLARPEVREAAGTLGLDLERATLAVDSLEAGELAELAATATLLDSQLAGGQPPTVSGGTGANFPFLYVIILLAIVLVFILT